VAFAHCLSQACNVSYEFSVRLTLVKVHNETDKIVIT